MVLLGWRHNNIYLLFSIHYICHLLYMGRIFQFHILHQNIILKITPKIVSCAVLFNLDYSSSNRNYYQVSAEVVSTIWGHAPILGDMLIYSEKLPVARELRTWTKWSRKLFSLEIYEMNIFHYISTINLQNSELCRGKIAFLGSHRIYLARNSQDWTPGSLIEVGEPQLGEQEERRRQPAANWFSTQFYLSNSFSILQLFNLSTY